MLLRSLPGIAARRSPPVYDEVTFRHLLAIESERSRRSGRPFLLLLFEWDSARDAGVDSMPHVGTKVFSTLSSCLRETDFIGWHLAHRVIGVALTELGDAVSSDVAERVAGRVADRLRAALPPSMRGRLRVRFAFNPEPSSGGLACSS